MHTHLVEAGATSRQAAPADSSRTRLWQMVARLAETEQERAVLVDSFAYGLSPRYILARHPDLFADIQAVYAAKRDLLDRIRHDCGLWDLRQDLPST